MFGARRYAKQFAIGALLVASACGNDETGGNNGAGAGAIQDTGGNLFQQDTAATDSGQAGSDGSGAPGEDTGAGTDTATTDTASADTAGTTDTASPDTATSSDAASADAAANDTAGTEDTAQAEDAGSADDGGAMTPDTAGGEDAAVTADAGTEDASGADTAAPDTAAPDTAGPKPKIVRFAALGDTGTASATQYKVGKVLADKCKSEGCDLVLLLGDNFYDTGVKDANDKQFEEKFEKPYADVPATFWVVLGNHDYGAGGAGAEFLKKDFYIDYGKKNAKWKMPDAWWHEQIGHVEFFALDSNSLLYGDILPFIITKQLADVDAWIKNSTADWKFTFAHHPYRSNGPHGNAGCYEGAKAAPIPQLCGLIPVASGKGVKEAYDKLLCGRVDAHFCGHDHSRQWLDKAASTKHCKDVELIVSGGGAKTTDVETKDKGGFEFNPFHFQDADKAGFMYVKIEGDTFYGEFIDEDGKVQYSRSFTRTK
ncbi:MAG: metallophosphoesterase [Deltaproteobacteria bacterium]|nr:metallophosphoesterase [Deltaproteobacteria bacterium]